MILPQEPIDLDMVLGSVDELIAGGRSSPDDLLSSFALVFNRMSSLFENSTLYYGHAVPVTPEPLAVEDVTKVLSAVGGLLEVWEASVRRANS